MLKGIIKVVERPGPVCYHASSALKLPGPFMLMTLGTIAIVLILGLPLLALVAGQFDLLSGARPTDLGIRNGLLKPPVETAWNVVSSHAIHQPHTDYHVIAPLEFHGEPKAAWSKLGTIVRNMDGATVISAQPNYLYAEFQSKLLRFVDDAEFVLDEPSGVIHMRSASRLRRNDFGANRARLESIRTRFNR